MPRSRKALFVCASPTNSVRSTPTISSRPYSPAVANTPEAPGRLALATVLQFVEGLSDRQAADDPHMHRTDLTGNTHWVWSLIDPGFDHTVLSEFRSRLIEGGAERLLLDTLLQHLRDRGLVKAKGRQRTELDTRKLAAVRGLNRLERVRRRPHARR